MNQESGVASSGPRPGDALPPLEMWAGVECTINRVGHRYRDQLALAGHYARAGDADRLADLGVRTVRWPVLWERHHDNSEAWRITDAAMETFRRRGVEPIVGLLHHGSGPSHTSLLSDDFPDALAAHASAVARRYPWVRRFTPINEPLTTARFSALYGLWFPHARSDAAFVRATVNQIVGTQRAMRAIRREIPDAELVATEDLGFAHSSPLLRYQAAFENERRWLTFDLLAGRVDRHHGLWSYLRHFARVQGALAEIAESAQDAGLRPALHGVNHYLTSERFLHEDPRAYPPESYGGNGRHRYADVEAVRVLRDGNLGPQQLIEQAADRYATPVVVTEAHLACTREQQLKWLQEVWQAAGAARARGRDVRAVTAWSAFGSFEWRSLLTRDEGAYESGLFDLRAPEPRATALASMVRALATGQPYRHPALGAESWWRRDDRLAFPPQRGTLSRGSPSTRDAVQSPAGRDEHDHHRRPLLIVGAHGTLGVAFAHAATERGLPYRALSRRDLDIADAASVDACIAALRPWAIVNAAGWVRVDEAETQEAECMRANADGAAVLADACGRAGVALTVFSSDLVFGDGRDRPFVESAPISPLNVYGRSKAEAERRVLAVMPDAMVVRTSAFFGEWDDWNFVSRALAGLHVGQRVLAPDDAVVSPTHVGDLTHAVLDLLIDGERGVWHLANKGALSWFELAKQAAAHAGLDAAGIEACSSTELGWHAPRPSYSALDSERASLLDPLDDALARYTRTRAWERVATSAAFRHTLTPHPSAHPTFSLR